MKRTKNKKERESGAEKRDLQRISLPVLVE